MRAGGPRRYAELAALALSRGHAQRLLGSTTQPRPVTSTLTSVFDAATVRLLERMLARGAGGRILAAALGPVAEDVQDLEPQLAVEGEGALDVADVQVQVDDVKSEIGRFCFADDGKAKGANLRVNLEG